MPEVCGEAVCYADPATDEEYARRMAEMIQNDSLRLEMKARARERSLNFRWSLAAADTAQVLIGAARPTSAPPGTQAV